jgi:DUF1680 family protein
MRGPLVYCVEQADHGNTDVRGLRLPPEAKLTPEFRPEMLGGVTVLRATARMMDHAVWDGALYQSAEAAKGSEAGIVAMTAIPYYAWANRAAGPMTVWIRTA